MAVISMRDLLEAGVHFGHSKGRWNPKMAPFLYGVRNGIHIIDLNKTVIYLEQAYNFIADKVAEGAEILFLGTKKQAKDVIKEEAERAGVPYINERWVGGLLTNFRTVKKSMLKLKTLERMEAEGVFDVLPKKEVRVMRRKMERLRKLYGGILNLERVPDIIWIVDTVREHIALQ
ncbi:MAG: 30S ribosomal protein S2, partial [Hydrogenobacter sp.]